MTHVIQIGNSDNKLTQREWAEFVHSVDISIRAAAMESNLYFFGGSSNWEPWQNCCWVFDPDPRFIDDLIDDLKRKREQYHQDSVALTIGETKFV